MSPGAENRSRCALLTLSVPPRPRRDGFSMELEARIWFAAPQRRYLRAMKTRPCAPGKINAPPRLTSQNISPAPFRLSLRRGQSFKSADWKKKKRRNIEPGSSFVRFLAAKIEFSYGAGQTVNLLALRLQWFESTPAQAFPKAILQVFKPFGGQLGISFPVSDTNPFAVSPERSVLVLFDDQSSLTIKTAGAAPVSPGTKVKSIRKAKADSKIEFESGSTV